MYVSILYVYVYIYNDYMCIDIAYIIVLTMLIASGGDDQSVTRPGWSRQRGQRFWWLGAATTMEIYLIVIEPKLWKNHRKNGDYLVVV